MNRFLMPKLSRQFLKVCIPSGVSCFLSFKLLDPLLPPISYNAHTILLVLIIPLLMGDLFFWVIYFPCNKSREQIIFLSTLPVLRKNILRDDIKLFFYVHACFISLILITGLLLYLPGLLTGMQLFRIIVISLWITICTLFALLMNSVLKKGILGFLVYTLTIILVILPLGFLMGVSMTNPDLIVKVLLGIIACSMILTVISLLLQRYNENRFMNKDLL